jgi:isopenicillin-N epimerase
MGHDLARHWGLDPAVTFLNHGSFGACPIPVLEAQSRLRRQMEAQPILFLHREGEAMLDRARQQLAVFLGADPDGLVSVPNATAGVNTVLRSFPLSPGDELLVTDHEYNACRNALNETAARTGSLVTVAPLPFPVDSPDTILEAIVSRVTPRTRLALLDHITSSTALVLPVERIVRGLQAHHVAVLVDGAHAPGMIPLDLDTLGAEFYTGNCHKWLCAPKGAAFLWVRADRRDGVRPIVTSHGANSPRTDRSRFRLEFDWTGTSDPTPFLCVPEAIRFLGNLRPGGWPDHLAANRALALRGGEILRHALGVPACCPEEMIGSMVTLPLPDAPPGSLDPVLLVDALQLRLFERFCIEVPIILWPTWSQRWVRISAQAYNREEQYQDLGRALVELLAEEAAQDPPGAAAGRRSIPRSSNSVGVASFLAASASELPQVAAQDRFDRFGGPALPPQPGHEPQAFAVVNAGLQSGGQVEVQALVPPSRQRRAHRDRISDPPHAKSQQNPSAQGRIGELGQCCPGTVPVEQHSQVLLSRNHPQPIRIPLVDQEALPARQRGTDPAGWCRSLERPPCTRQSCRAQRAGSARPDSVKGAGAHDG